MWMGRNEVQVPGCALRREDGAGGIPRQRPEGAQPRHQACLSVPCSEARPFHLAASLPGTSCIVGSLSTPWFPRSQTLPLGDLSGLFLPLPQSGK